jgi:hypothetical protein
MGKIRKPGRRGLPASEALLWRLWMLPPAGSARGTNARKSPADDDHPERGDVPGWVMITLMSAALVAGLLALAGPALEGLFNQAMSKVGK